MPLNRRPKMALVKKHISTFWDRAGYSRLQSRKDWSLIDKNLQEPVYDFSIKLWSSLYAHIRGFAILPFPLDQSLPYSRMERLTKWNKILTSEKHDSIKIKYAFALKIAGEVEFKMSPIEM